MQDSYRGQFLDGKATTPQLHHLVQHDTDRLPSFGHEKQMCCNETSLKVPLLKELQDMAHKLLQSPFAESMSIARDDISWSPLIAAPCQ